MLSLSEIVALLGCILTSYPVFPVSIWDVQREHVGGIPTVPTSTATQTRMKWFLKVSK